MNHLSNIVFAYGLALALSSCSAPGRINIQPTQVAAVEISASPRANQGKPVTIDLVFATDRAALKELEGFTASGWYSVKDLQVDLGQWDDKAIWTEVAVEPGEVKTITDFPEGYEKAVGLVVFATYQTPGLHRLVIVNSRNIKVLLEEATISSPQGKSYLLTSPPEPVPGNRQM